MAKEFVIPGRAAVILLSMALAALAAPALAASGKEPAPPGSFKGAPSQYTRFTTHELMRGFLALAFGSDFLVGKRPKGIRRYTHPVTARVIAGGKVDRSAAMTRVIEEYARRVPNLHLRVVAADTPADVEVRLVDEKNFAPALKEAFGEKVAREFIRKNDPICMTSVKSDDGGAIVHSTTFVVVDQGNEVFLDCAYHELLHAFGLPNHDQRNPWTTLNQDRTVGYLSVYDHALVTLLYDPRIEPGMTARTVRKLLPGIIADLGLAKGGRRH